MGSDVAMCQILQVARCTLTSETELSVESATRSTTSCGTWSASRATLTARPCMG